MADTEIKLVKKGKSNFTSINSNKPCTFCQKWLGKDHAALALCEYLDRNKVSIAVILVLCTIGGSAWYVSKYGIPACLCWWSTKNKKSKERKKTPKTPIRPKKPKPFVRSPNTRRKTTPKTPIRPKKPKPSVRSPNTRRKLF